MVSWKIFTGRIEREWDPILLEEIAFLASFASTQEARNPATN